MKRNREQGSVLFLILVAVMLFGALSFTVAQIMRTGDPESIGERQASLYADEILSYARQVREAVQNMRISNGCGDTEISMENNFVAGYTNAGAPTDNSCHVFKSDGGGVTWIESPEEWLDSGFSANTNYGDFNFYSRSCTESTTCHSDGLDNEDLIVFFPYIKQKICLQINERLGINNPSGDAPIDAGCSGAASSIKFTGSYAENVSLKDTAGDLNQNVGCYRHDAGCAGQAGSYHLYQVLIAR